MATWVVSGTDAAATDSDKSLTIAMNSKAITAATKAANCQLTITGHGMNVNEYVYITGVVGMTQLNSNYHQIASVVDANNITINTNSTGYSTYTSGGTANVEGTSLQNPCNIRSVGHNVSIGDVVNVSGVVGTTQMNNLPHTVSAILSVDCFSVSTNASAYTRYTSGGTGLLYYRIITGATQANPCSITVTGHGRATGSRIYIQYVGGMTQLNGKTFTITSTGTDTFTLDGVDSSAFGAYTTGGTISWVRDTMRATVNRAVANDTILVEKTTTTSLAGGITFTWTRNSNSVTTSASTVGTVLVGDVIGPTTASMNGHTTSGYKVTSVGAASITIENRFWHSDSVSSISEAGCLRFNPVSEGLINNNLLLMDKNVIVQCGYTFTNNTAPTRDSFSLYKHAVNKTTSSHLGVNFTSGGTVQYLSIVDCYYNYQIGHQDATLEYFTSISPQIYGILTTVTEPTISNFFGFSSSASYPAFYASGGAITLGSNCYGISFPSAGGMAFQSVVVYLKNAKARVSNIGLYAAASGSSIQDSESRFVAQQHLYSAPSIFGSMFKNCVGHTGGSYGYLSGTTSASCLVENCDFYGSTYGAYMSQSQGNIIKDCTFDGHSYGFAIDQYCGDHSSLNNSYSNISVNIFNRATGGGGTIISVGDTIDDASRYRGFNVPQYSGMQNLRPYYAFQDSLGITGLIYPYAQITRNAGASPYTIFTFNARPNNEFPFFLLKVAARAGTGMTIDYSLSVPSAITADITPVVFLNGIEIQDETAISSFTTYATWTDYTVTLTGGTITENGLIELGFRINSGTGTLYFKCNDVT